MAQLTSSKTVGTAVVSGTLNGYPMASTVSVVFAPMGPSVTKSTVTVLLYNDYAGRNNHTSFKK
ncbi:hypothetical protein [Paenibacillus caui]|uniref:hypothetical protein n=1 Tax=Paenibacillus caui TaxID=2873927 RepID=UPI001CA84615|nr:hypothetical protein [Paenibacillus caui]